MKLSFWPKKPNTFPIMINVHRGEKSAVQKSRIFLFVAAAAFRKASLFPFTLLIYINRMEINSQTHLLKNLLFQNSFYILYDLPRKTIFLQRIYVHKK